ncbi:MAG: hypothetical protein R2764_24910 [Bacteroidales bacterium]
MEVSTIVFLGILLLLIILILVFRKPINLLIIRIRFGKFSYQFVKKFKKYANKSPYPYCFKDDIMPYLRLIVSKREVAEQFISEKEIHFENLDRSLTIDELIKKQGEPTCYNVFRIKNAELRAYGYTIHKFETNLKCVFFFLNGLFFMAEYLVDSIKEVDLNLVATSIFEQTEIKQTAPITNFVIDCKNNTSILFYENGFSLLIRYLDNNNQDFPKKSSVKENLKI